MYKSIFVVRDISRSSYLIGIDSLRVLQVAAGIACDVFNILAVNDSRRGRMSQVRAAVAAMLERHQFVCNELGEREEDEQ
jgi:hypothetical protein